MSDDLESLFEEKPKEPNKKFDNPLDEFFDPDSGVETEDEGENNKDDIVYNSLSKIFGNNRNFKKEGKTILESKFGEDDNVDMILSEEEKGLKKQFEKETEIEKYVSISHGWNKDDYIWHIGPAIEKRPWKHEHELILRGLIEIFNKYIPKSVLMDIFPPSRTMNIPEFTFKAIGLKNEWSVQPDDISSINQTIFKEMNKALE